MVGTETGLKCFEKLAGVNKLLDLSDDRAFQYFREQWEIVGGLKWSRLSRFMPVIFRMRVIAAGLCEGGTESVVVEVGD